MIQQEPLWKQYKKEYSVWAQMKNRCNSPKHPQFQYWGSKGVKVCERWKLFENFITDMGPRPSGKYSLERSNGDKDYSPDNCYWATDLQQNNNTSRNVYLRFNGKLQTLKQWADELDIAYDRLHARYRYGWPAEKILTVPRSQHHKKWKI